MGYEIVVTQLAIQDLNGILAYIVNTLANSAAASAFLDDVETCYGDLESAPLMYE